MIGLLLALGCPKAPPPPPTWASVPHLPSPTAGSYGRSLETPPDPPLVPLVENRRWDASLAGAAAGLALSLIRPTQERTLTRWAVREAAWRAGWPYPIADARAWTAMPDGAPPPQLLAWLETVDPGDDLGLVRARGQDHDLWVGLTSRPRITIGRIPRQIAVGAELTLPALPGVRYTIADADGQLHSGTLDAPLRLTAGSRGEWLVRLDDEAGTVALFPIYVGLVPPDLPLFDEARPIRTPVDAMVRAEELLTAIRASYGTGPAARDFMLDAGARSLLTGGGTTPEGVQESLGLDPLHTALWICEGITVETCLDDAIWVPEHRLALLDDRSALGLAAATGEEGVRLVGILSRID